MTIHPAVRAAYAATLRTGQAVQDATDHSGRCPPQKKSAHTRAGRHLGAAIRLHHPGLTMQQDIALRTQLQNEEPAQ